MQFKVAITRSRAETHLQAPHGGGGELRRVIHHAARVGTASRAEAAEELSLASGEGGGVVGGGIEGGGVVVWGVFHRALIIRVLWFGGALRKSFSKGGGSPPGGGGKGGSGGPIYDGADFLDDFQAFHSGGGREARREYGEIIQPEEHALPDVRGSAFNGLLPAVFAKR